MASTPKQYIIGVDPAGGGCDGDYACAQVIERSTGLQCAELHGHFTPAGVGGPRGAFWAANTTTHWSPSSATITDTPSSRTSP